MPGETTVYRWLEQKPEFREKYARARRIQQDRAVDEIVEIADTCTNPKKARLQIDARKWRASKLAPKKYGERVDVAHSGEVDVAHRLTLIAELREAARRYEEKFGTPPSEAPSLPRPTRQT